MAIRNSAVSARLWRLIAAARRQRKRANAKGDPLSDRNERAPYNALFLCTGNSARSIMGEAILNRAGQGRFRAFSAGSHPTGRVHPYAIDLLRRLNYDVTGARSKSWAEFEAADAPQLDVVCTVCDDAAAATCPVWPGQPMTAHWGIPDPAAAAGKEAEVRLAFADALRMLTNRINIFVSLPLRSLDQLSLQNQLRAIGIMAERLAGGNQAIALLGNTIPTGAILVVIITIFGPVSGAHFNPAVTLVFAARRTTPGRRS